MPLKYKKYHNFIFSSPDIKCTHKNTTFDTHIATYYWNYDYAIDPPILPKMGLGGVYGANIVWEMYGNMGIKSFVLMSTFDIWRRKYKIEAILTF